MKVKYFFLIIVCAAIVCLSIPAHASVAVGATAWYADWGYKPNTSDKTNPGLLYGPVFSVDLVDKWSLAGVFLSGVLNEEFPGEKTYNRRYDGDLTLNYNYTRYVKFFGGLKFMRYDWTHDGSKPGLFRSGEGYNRGVGPGLGVGFAVPVTDSLFTLMNFSGLYTYGKMSEFQYTDDRNLAMHTYGFNTSVALAYYVDSINSTISLGGRFQYLKSIFPGHSDNNMRMYFYGVTLTATYHFRTE
jgi:hypothetical protein